MKQPPLCLLLALLAFTGCQPQDPQATHLDSETSEAPTASEVRAAANPSDTEAVPAEQPAWDADYTDTDPDDWTYELYSYGAHYALVFGDLRYSGAHLDASPGDIITTPLGEFMFFHESNSTLPPMFYQGGWLNATPDGQALFNEDGSLTNLGSTMREVLKDQNAEVVIPRFVEAIEAGMTRQAVYAALEEHLGGTSGYSQEQGETTLIESFSLPWANRGMTVVYVLDPQATERVWIVAEQDNGQVVSVGPLHVQWVTEEFY